MTRCLPIAVSTASEEVLGLALRLERARHKYMLCALAATVVDSPGPMPGGEDAHVARELQVGTRIVGGVPTGVQEFEWLVNLRDTRFGQEGFCGGTLVTAVCELIADGRALHDRLQQSE